MSVVQNAKKLMSMRIKAPFEHRVTRVLPQRYPLHSNHHHTTSIPYNRSIARCCLRWCLSSSARLRFSLSASSTLLPTSKSQRYRSLEHLFTSPAANGTQGLQVESIEEIEEEIDNPSKTPALNVQISASFPNSEVFGVKLVNGHPTQVVLSVDNQEPEEVVLQFVGGSLMTPVGVPGAPSPPQIVRNLTAQRYGVSIPAGEGDTLTYTFVNEMHPQDLTLNLAAVIQNHRGDFFTKQVYNETVSVVEAPSSIFDPQM